MEDVVKVVETGLGAFSRPDGGVVQPVRSVVPVTEHSGWVGRHQYLAHDACIYHVLFTINYTQDNNGLVLGYTVSLQ